MASFISRVIKALEISQYNKGRINFSNNPARILALNNKYYNFLAPL